MNFWQEPNWIKLKTFSLKTDKVLSKTEYLKEIGYKNFTEEKYREYLTANKAKSESGKDFRK